MDSLLLTINSNFLKYNDNAIIFIKEKKKQKNKTKEEEKNKKRERERERETIKEQTHHHGFSGWLL